MEPNGVTKGALLPMPEPTPVPAPAPVPVPPVPASAPPPATVPVLPDNMNAMVPIGAIIHRMTNDAYAELSNLSETLPSRSDTERKVELLKYTLSKREQFIKLLVLTKWGKNAKKFQQCQNIVGFLQHENELFTRAVGGLFETYKMFGRARVRNFDIPTAIDVLTTGTYQRLPSRIKQTYVEDDKPTRAEVAATLEKLDDVIRMRLLCDELVPPAMKYTVGKGKVKFTVANEFEVTLTVSGPGSPEDVSWRIVSLKILAKPVGGSFQGLETSLNEGQMRAIITFAQKELDSVSTANAAHHPGLPVQTNPLPANQALLRLYDYLHMLSLHLLIELVCTQAYQLSRSGWTDRLRLDVNQSRSVVRLVYWNNGYVPQPVQQQQLAPPPKRRASATLTAGGQAKETAQSLAAQQEHYLEIRIEEREGPTEPIPEGLAGALVDPKLLCYPKAFVKVVWSQVAKGIVPESEVASILELDPSQLHVERLLLRAVNMHTGQVMQGFYDRLWSYIESIKDKREAMEGTHFSKDDVMLEAMDSGEQQHSAAGTAGLPGPRALLVRLKGDRWIRIRIDVRTGRVVVREVGKTGEGDDSIIAAFQARLNENANNVIDALISLRFSMTIVELESIGILLGLQPYRRLALGKLDAAKFGVDIQQILFLQYPQHPRHYLVVGVIEQRFRVWLIEVAPDKEIVGNWLSLKSFEPVYLTGLRRRRREIDGGNSYSVALSKRKSVQFDIDDNGTSDPPSVDEMSIDQDVMTKLEALCRVRICLNEAKNQLQELGIQYRPVSKKDEGSTGNKFPILRLDPKTISTGKADDMFEFVGAKLTGWWDSQRETCNFEVKAQFFPDVTPPNMESGPLDSCVHYHAKTRTLSFTYKTRGAFVRQFQQDWETIIRMLKIIRQLHAPTLTNPHIRLQLCSLPQVQLQYFGRYTVSFRWVPALTSEKRSSSGVLIPSAPRFRQGLYELALSEVPSDKGRYVNPHRRMKSFLQDMFNREGDLHSLMNTMVQTCSILEVLDRLENSVKEDSMGVKVLSIVPRAAHHIRVIFGSRYALDIRAYNRTNISMHDASFPSESFGSSLPPPPGPALAPTLLTTPGRTISPTTKGHLHYGVISNLQGVIENIDVDKEDEEFNAIQRAIEAATIPPPIPHNNPNLHAPSSITLLKQQQQLHLQQQQQQQLHQQQEGAIATRAADIEQDDEPYEVMPLPYGVVCSRSTSGRVLYRIAKHMESLV
ncbi:mediator complex subunit [Mortierella sp. AD031]|nr:mediator complex subunit [Mortierella sp. AD031]